MSDEVPSQTSGFTWHDTTLERQMRDAQDATPKPGAIETAAAAFRQTQIANALRIRLSGMTPFSDDSSDFRLSQHPDLYKAWTAGIPSEWHPAFNEARGQGHGWWIRDQLLSKMKDEQTLTDSGYGTPLTLGMSLLDPIQGVMIAGMGAAGIGARASRIANAAEHGVAGAALNAATESMLNPQADGKDIGQAAALGFMLGAPMGALGRVENARLNNAGRNADEAITLERMKRAGVLAPSGEKRLLELKQHGDSVEVLPPEQTLPGIGLPPGERPIIEGESRRVDETPTLPEHKRLPAPAEEAPKAPTPAEVLAQVDHPSAAPEAPKVAPEAPTPAPAPGMVRYYHGGSPEGVTGPLWFTSSLQDARGWASRDEGAGHMGIWHVDVPEHSPVRGEGDLANGIPHSTRVEMPAEVANQRKLFKEAPKAAPKAEPAPKAAPKAEPAAVPESHQYDALAKELGARIENGDKPVHSDGTIHMPEMNEADFQAKYTEPRWKVLLHELGHHLASKWDMMPSLKGPAFAALRAELRAASKEFRPGVRERFPGHTEKPNELWADGIAYWIANPDKRALMPEMNKWIGNRLSDITEAEKRLAGKAAAPEAPKAPAHDFQKGDTVSWTDKSGHHTGEITGLTENGKLMVKDDATGEVRGFSPKKVESLNSVAGDIEGGFTARSPEGDGFTGMEYSKFSRGIRVFGKDFLREWIRWDYFARGERTENDVARELLRRTTGDSVGGTGERQRITATEWAQMEQGHYNARAGIALKEAQLAYIQRLGLNPMQWMKHDIPFHKKITEAMRSWEDQGAMANLRRDHPEAVQAAEQLRKINEELLHKLDAYGVKGIDVAHIDPAWVMRRFSHKSVAWHMSQYGSAEMEKLVSGAIMDARPHVTQADALAIAKGYIAAITALPYEKGIRLASLGAADRAELVDAMMRKGIGAGNPALLQEITDMLVGHTSPQAGTHARLKDRTVYNERFKMQLRDRNGQLKDVTVSDLFENDARLLQAIYTRQATGMLGYAKVGIQSAGDLEVELAKVRDHQMATDSQHFARAQQFMEDQRALYNHSIGKPMSAADNPFGTAERASRVLRKAMFILNMGESGFAQVPDLGNTIGLAGWRASMAHMPILGKTFRSALNGTLDDQLGRDLLQLGGINAESLINHPLVNDIVDGAPDAMMTKAENWASRGAQSVSHLSGLVALDSSLRAFASRSFVQKFVNWAHGIDVASINWKKMADAGIDGANWPAIEAGLRQHTVREAGTGKVTHLDWDAWRAADQTSSDAFQLAMWRESRRAVQQHSIGETSPWMHTEIGKILTQFRTFMLVAHNKQFLYGISHFDAQTFNAWMLSTVFGGLAYVAQSSANYAHNPEELQKRLTPEHIVASAINKAGYSGLIPTLTDSTYGLAFGPVFGYGRTSALPSGGLAGVPLVNFGDKVMGTLKAGAQAAFNSDDVLTKREATNGMSMILPNMLGIRNMVDAIGSNFPKSDPLDNR